MKYSFDSECLRLAEHFLPEEATQAVMNELAQAIQDTVEDFFCGREIHQNRGSNLNNAKEQGQCSDCPSVGYPTDETRCVECPCRAAKASGSGE